jgi:carboxymethylenebutenolidase
MGSTIELAARDGHRFSAYRALPEGGAKPRGGIVVIQEIFGVNNHVRRVADGFAAQGYAAIAPALFDRIRPGIELGYDAGGIAEGREVRAEVGWDGPLADVQAAIDAAAAYGRVGVVGYCWGGSLAFLAATRLKGLACAVGYYGGQIAQYADEQTHVPVILHFGEKDHAIPMSDVDRIRKAHPDMSIFTYPADHGFNCDERGSYDAASAALALERTLLFFDAKLGGK